MIVGRAKRWLRGAQDRTPVRLAIDGAQVCYGAARRVRGDRRPAVEGGWPVRAVPLPPPRPITRAERARIRRFARGQSTSFFDGGAVRALEERFRERLGVQHVLVCSSGTSALHIALSALGIGPGDEVIVPTLTYVATALAVLHTGAEVRFADADPSDWNLDVESARAAITPRTKAIVPVHIGGVPCDMVALGDLAEQHGLAVVEDAAHAHCSSLDGRAMGSFGAFGCFSFGSPKPITTGEGGLVVTDDEGLYLRAREIMNLGERARGGPSMEIDLFEPETRLDYPAVGWNYRMSLAQAALGHGQLDRYEAIRARRRENGRVLREALGAHPAIEVQELRPGADVGYYTFPMVLRPGASLSRGELLEGLRRERIDFRLWSNRSLSQHDVFRSPGSFPVAERVSAGSIGLRVDPALGPRHMRETVEAITRLLG